MKVLGKFTGLVAAALGGFGMREAQAGNRYYSGPISDHFDGKIFFNPGGEEPRGFTDLLLLAGQLVGGAGGGKGPDRRKIVDAGPAGDRRR